MGRPGLTGHRKFDRLSRLLGGNEALALGSLEFMWERCYQNGDPYLGDSIDVEAAAKWKGDQGVLCRALLDAGGGDHAGFIEEVEGHPGRYQCHDLFDHAPSYVGKRLERELARRQAGKTLSMIRSEAGRKGAMITNRSASGRQMVGNLPDGDQQVAATPLPAPLPAPLTATAPPPAVARGPKPRGRSFGLALTSMSEDVRVEFLRAWNGYPTQGWNFETKSWARRRLNQEGAAKRFLEIVEHNTVQTPHGPKLTAKDLADLTLYFVSARKRHAEKNSEHLNVPCIENFYSTEARSKANPWQNAAASWLQSLACEVVHV